MVVLYCFLDDFAFGVEDGWRLLHIFFDFPFKTKPRSGTYKPSHVWLDANSIEASIMVVGPNHGNITWLPVVPGCPFYFETRINGRSSGS